MRNILKFSIWLAESHMLISAMQLA